MKNLIPFLSVIGASVLLVSGCEGNLTKVNTLSETNICYTSTNAELENFGNEIEKSENLEIVTDDLTTEFENELENEEDCCENISNLYSISCEIDNCCENFCTLKQNLTDAILETKTLIEKFKNEEIELTSEQRLSITEQAKQLKSLAKEFANTTTELTLNLSDLYSIINAKDFDNLSLKYLIVLDNLVNSNEMLNNGLNSLNTIKNIFTYNSDNNGAQISHEYQKNNEPPIIKNYDITKNGDVIEKENINSPETEVKITDTYKNNPFKSNIDTFGNKNNNIDSFFNTAWLDNEFMYGNGYNNGIMNNGYVPYVQNQKSSENKTIPSVNSNTTTQQNEDLEKIKNKNKFKLQKNIDTYRDEKTPTVSAKLTIIKNSISNFFDNFKSEEDINEIKQKFNN